VQNKNHHVSDEDLLLAADGELSPRREARVHTHLAQCADCRARKERLEGVAAEISRAHLQDVSGEVPPSAGSRAALQTQLAARSKGATPVRPWAWVVELFAERRWVYVAAAFLIAALGLRLLSHEMWPNVSRGQMFASGSGPALPEPRLTPGVAQPISSGQVCSPGPSDQMATIPMRVRQAVFHEYGIDGSQQGEYEVDHLITPELGGTDDIRNLWPEPYASTEWNAHVKDELENHLRRLVCDGKLDLPTAQRDIATNWISAYQKYFHTEKPLSDVSSLAWAQEREPSYELRAELTEAISVR